LYAKEGIGEKFNEEPRTQVSDRSPSLTVRRAPLSWHMLKHVVQAVYRWPPCGGVTLLGLSRSGAKNRLGNAASCGISFASFL